MCDLYSSRATEEVKYRENFKNTPERCWNSKNTPDNYEIPKIPL
jgi:hypothetical protein